MKSFPEGTIPCTKTLYNMLLANKLPLSLFNLPHALGRKKHRKWNRKNKRMFLSTDSLCCRGIWGSADFSKRGLTRHSASAILKAK